MTQKHKDIILRAAQPTIELLFSNYYVDGDLDAFVTRYKKVMKCVEKAAAKLNNP